jgi:hypothetical protein
MHGKGGRGDHIPPFGDEGEGDFFMRIISTGMRDRDDLCSVGNGTVFHTMGGTGMIREGPEMKDTALFFIVGNAENPHVPVHIDLRDPDITITLISLRTAHSFLHMPA